MIDYFENAGYTSGLTLQSIPYNYYFSLQNNEVSVFKDILLRLKKLTGKKVVVVGHSMGSLNILY